MSKPQHRAPSTRLEPGQHSVDRVTPVWNDERGAWTMKWSVRLKDGRLIAGKRAQGATKAQVRQRAREAAEELLKTGGMHGAWKGTSGLADYIAQVSTPEVEKNTNENTLARYRLALKQLVGGCDDHKHENSLKGHSIASGARFRVLEGCLQEIAALHGSESARQARTVLGKYVVQQLIREGLLEGNPLAGMSIDLKTGARENTNRRGGSQSLSREQWLAALEYLLALDPEDVEKPRRGRWTRADAVAKRRATIDLALLQATTGLRQSEANRIDWSLVSVTQDAKMLIYVPKHIAKNKKPRTVPVLDPRVVERLNERRAAGALVIGSPTDQTAVWERGNCSKAARGLYDEAAEALGIEIMGTEAGRSHIWRATLNTVTAALGVPEEIRSANFGHDAETNRGAYLDHTNADAMLAAYAKLHDTPK
ncbi:hypothetical protein [Leucobacter chinensis]|uniref:hypothetical protein n=1 Tax=Leucobacter chinensis TaxID=2851010 RepID=UPI001C2218A3|nr:hypothetical protein [Leucobacter chinensis]